MIQDGCKQNCILELRELVAESAMRSIPDEHFAFQEEVLGIFAAAALWNPTSSFGHLSVEEKEEEDEEDEENRDGDKEKWVSWVFLSPPVS